MARIKELFVRIYFPLGDHLSVLREAVPKSTTGLHFTSNKVVCGEGITYVSIKHLRNYANRLIVKIQPYVTTNSLPVGDQLTSWIGPSFSSKCVRRY
jgi:hypothetical protein